MPECFFAHLGGCEGRLVKAHLISKQRIKREVPIAATRVPYAKRREITHDIVWDPRCWTWMCGGITGIGGHHGMFDAKQLTIPYGQLPPELLSFAEEYGLEWSLERDYA